jgi:MFS transporter, ACS family, D-galactonate transporter
MTLSPSGSRKLSAPTRAVVGLLAIVVFLNFMDRGSLSIAAPLLKDELRLSPSQLGVLLSSFFWTYTVCQIPAGWIVDKFEVSWVLAIGFVIWSSATFITGLVHGFAALLAIRLILGIGESVAYPSCWKILARCFPEHHRGFANAVVQAGQAAGPAVSTFAGGLLIGKFGWRPFFMVLGVASLFWLIPWFRWMPRQQLPVDDAQINGHHAGIREVLKHRSAWGTCVANFCVNWSLYLLLTWLPFYLVHERHFSLLGTAKIGGAAFLLKATSSLSSGWFSDAWIATGASPTLVRKTCLCVGFIASSFLFLMSAAVAAPIASVVLLLMGSVCFGFLSPHGPAIIQTLAGPQLTGTWSGLVLFVANFAGILAPMITGFIVDRTGHFFWAFGLAAAFAWVGAASYLLLVGPIEQVVWSVQKETEVVA